MTLPALNSGEIVATDCAALSLADLRYCADRGHARHRLRATRFEKRNQNGERKSFVSCFDHFVEAGWKPWLLGKRAEPFAVCVDEAAKLPFRHFKRDQRERCVDPCTRADQPAELGPRIRTVRWKALARICGDGRHQAGRDRLGPAKLIFEPTEVLLVFRVEQHDTTSRG